MKYFCPVCGNETEWGKDNYGLCCSQKCKERFENDFNDIFARMNTDETVKEIEQILENFDKE